jgi:hypothetical protein
MVWNVECGVEERDDTSENESEENAVHIPLGNFSSVQLFAYHFQVKLCLPINQSIKELRSPSNTFVVELL